MLESCCNSKINAINISICFKILICSVIGQDYQLIMNGNLNKQTILAEFVKKISIHIVHIENFSYVLYKYVNIAPIAYIYSNRSHYGLIYHVSVKYLDEKSDNFGIDFRAFPFIYNPSKSFSPKIAVVANSTNSNFLDIISLLIHNLKPLDSTSKSNLLIHVNSLKILCPEIQDRVQDLYEKAISKCGHQGREYTAVCLQNHCMDCLIDIILDSRGGDILCPCGTPLDESDLQFLTSDNIETPKVAKAEKKYASLSPIRRNGEKIISKKCSINGERSSFSQTFQRLPIINNTIPCIICRKNLNKDSYTGIKCEDHHICLKCRSKRFKKSTPQCPACNRLYNNDEITVIKMLNNSIDLTSSLLKTRNFIDTL